MRKQGQNTLILGAALCCMSSAFSATPVDLSEQPVSYLQSFTSIHSTSVAQQSALKQTSSKVDFNKTEHIRVQQTYSGYPVWGGDAVVHIPNGGNKSLANAVAGGNSATTMDGVVYQDLNNDLANTPAYVFNSAQASKALQQAVGLYQKKSGLRQDVSDSKTNLMVFVDKSNKAHWAFFVSFTVKPVHAMPAKPTYIMDATTFDVYQNWDNVQTLDSSSGGGFGGNEKMGKLVYDGLKGSFPALDIQRDAIKNMCYLSNSEVTVKDRRNNDQVSEFKCETTAADHNKIYWNADQDAVNGGYSPSNDALFVGKVVKSMYQEWYDVPVLTSNGKPMMLNMRVHEDMDNAYWDGQEMTFGDGVSMFYPLVSLGVGAHEVSHGFTEQHSALVYSGQSGGLNESFSDMAAQAAEFYATKTNSWQIGPEIFKAKDEALRYMDEPTKDCAGRKPGSWCSISHMKDYKDSLDVHFTSGIFNKLFYLMGTAWDTKKAFDVMVQANQYYWTSNTSFKNAACGVVKATKDYGYDVKTVKTALKKVGITVAKKC